MLLCAKGIETGSLKTMSEVAAEILAACPSAVLSGPTFAPEVARDLPTAVTIASADASLGRAFMEALGSSRFRPYLSQDPIGAEIGGAVKNVLAIACGVVVGRGLGDNARASLITRGLAEITRLGAVLGADPMTFAGLTGMGDLILTATGSLSRNRTLGVDLGKGKTLEQSQAGKQSVAEGVLTARAAVALGERHNVELPIAQEVSAILFDGKSPRRAIADLMDRELKAEQWR